MPNNSYPTAEQARERFPASGCIGLRNHYVSSPHRSDNIFDMDIITLPCHIVDGQGPCDNCGRTICTHHRIQCGQCGRQVCLEGAGRGRNACYVRDCSQCQNSLCISCVETHTIRCDDLYMQQREHRMRECMERLAASDVDEDDYYEYGEDDACTRPSNYGLGGNGKYGMELELVPATEYDGASSIRSAARDESWGYSYDGSLPDYGVEVKTNVHKLPEMREKLQRFFENCPRIDNDDCAGTHIHTARKNMYGFAARIRSLLACPTHEAFFDDLFRRGPNHFCTRGSGIYDRSSRQRCSAAVEVLRWYIHDGWTKRSDKFPHTRSKYSCIHVDDNDHYNAFSHSEHYPTWEFRAFAGARTALQAASAVEAFDLLTRVLKPGAGVSAHDVYKFPENIDLPRVFMQGLAKYRNEYPALERRVMVSPNDRLRKYQSTYNIEKALLRKSKCRVGELSEKPRYIRRREAQQVACV